MEENSQGDGMANSGSFSGATDTGTLNSPRNGAMDTARNAADTARNVADTARTVAADTARSAADTARSAADTARNAASNIAEKGQAALAGVREKASSLPGMIADGLEHGAEALRSGRVQSLATANGAPPIADDMPIAQASERLASGMQVSADWLRDADLDKLKMGLERQVKEHPARTLLIALGAGYLLGKAIRR